jgi:hypothetical protein
VAGRRIARPVYPSFGDTPCVPALTLRAKLGSRNACSPTIGRAEASVRISNPVPKSPSPNQSYRCPLPANSRRRPVNLPLSAFRISIPTLMALFNARDIGSRTVENCASLQSRAKHFEQSTWGIEHVSLLRLQLRSHGLIPARSRKRGEVGNINNPPAPDTTPPAARRGRRRRGCGRQALRRDRRRASGLRRPRPASRPSSAPGYAGTSAPR